MQLSSRWIARRHPLVWGDGAKGLFGAALLGDLNARKGMICGIDVDLSGFYGVAWDGACKLGLFKKGNAPHVFSDSRVFRPAFAGKW